MFAIRKRCLLVYLRGSLYQTPTSGDPRLRGITNDAVYIHTQQLPCPSAFVRVPQASDNFAFWSSITRSNLQFPLQHLLAILIRALVRCLLRFVVPVVPSIALKLKETAACRSQNFRMLSLCSIFVPTSRSGSLNFGHSRDSLAELFGIIANWESIDSWLLLNNKQES